MITEIKTNIYIHEGYKFKRIDNKWYKGEHYIECNNVIKRADSEFESMYLWIILEKL